MPAQSAQRARMSGPLIPTINGKNVRSNGGNGRSVFSDENLPIVTDCVFVHGMTAHNI